MKKFSKKWMATFIDGELPKDDNLILEQVSKKGFEVEGFEVVKDANGKEDSLFEIKVLPNRIADAFSVRGMAREFAAVFDLKWGGNIPTPDLSSFKLNNDFVSLPEGDSKQLGTGLGGGDYPLYIFTGVKVKNFDNTVETPEWIKDIITKSGGRSINLLVDITNLMLFSFGQPAHVFDADKLTGKIVTRFAAEGEELELLDGKKIKLKNTDFVIADEVRALSLAGIKGGRYAETTKETKNCVFEMANFSPTMIRKTSTHLGIRTDASKIFENGITTNKTEEALSLLLATLKELNNNVEIEFIINKKNVDKSPTWVETSFKLINDFAGKEISNEKIVELLKSQNFEVVVEGQNLKVKASSERLDVNIAEDVAEEVLRLYGFDNLESKPLNLSKTTKHSNMFLLENFIRVKLFGKGYTEIFNYTFVPEGEIKLKAGLAEDKMYLRNNLEEGMKLSFIKNYNYLPIVESDTVKTFEMGSVFGDKGEFRNCVINFDDNKKKSKYLPEIEKDITEICTPLLKGVDTTEGSGGGFLKILNRNEKPALLEFSLNDLLAKIEEQNTTIPFLKIEKELQSINYKPISIYPFIVRDVACFVPESYSNFNNLKSEIQKLNLQNVEKIYKFDEFTKILEDGSKKTSIAFRIIFQSYEKTLTDTEVEAEMVKVNEYLKTNGFEIR
jgi:phenylalanyl-tRNA synthetase beta chain